MSITYYYGESSTGYNYDIPCSLYEVVEGKETWANKVVPLLSSPEEQLEMLDVIHNMSFDPGIHHLVVGGRTYEVQCEYLGEGYHDEDEESKAGS